MRIRILSSAFRDLAKGRDFYDEQAVGVGDYFLDCLFADIDSLARQAGVHRKFFGFHRMLAERFPWAVYYRLEGEGVVVVYRVLDCRQNLAKTTRALRRL